MPVVSKKVTVAITDTQIDGPQINRSYVGIQNTDATNPIYVVFGGAEATVATGLVILAGEFFDTHAPFNGTEIRAISTGGSVGAIFLFGH